MNLQQLLCQLNELGTKSGLPFDQIEVSILHHPSQPVPACDLHCKSFQIRLDTWTNFPEPVPSKTDHNLMGHAVRRKRVTFVIPR